MDIQIDCQEVSCKNCHDRNGEDCVLVSQCNEKNKIKYNVPITTPTCPPFERVTLPTTATLERKNELDVT